MNVWKILALMLLVAAAACERPNLDDTGGGYRRAETVADTAETGHAVPESR